MQYKLKLTIISLCILYTIYLIFIIKKSRAHKKEEGRIKEEGLIKDEIFKRDFSKRKFKGKPK